MRLLLVLVLLGLFGATAWHAVQLGTIHRFAQGAPQIETRVDQGARAALTEAGLDTISVQTSGRTVTLSGSISGEDVRNQALAAVARTPLIKRLDDRIDVLQVASPFVLSAVKSPDGNVRLDGNVPDLATEEMLLQHTRGLTSGALGTGLKRAAGAPEGDWAGMALAAITALSYLDNGAVLLQDDRVEISGTAANAQALNAAALAIREAPMGQWSNQITGAIPIAAPFVFSAMKTPDGAVIVGGNAPDAAVQASLMEAANTLGATPAGGGLEIAAGMPDDGWPDRVRQGLVALGAVQNGLLELSDNAVTLTAEVDTDADLDALLPKLGEAWIAEITVLNPTPPGDVTLILSKDGTLSGKGRLPEGLTEATLVGALPELSFQNTDPDTTGKAVDWSPALEGLNIVLPRFNTATVTLTDRAMTLTGALKRGFSGEGSAASLRSVLGRDWNLTLDIAESAPLAEAMLGKDERGISLSGVLPQGLLSDQALMLLGNTASGEGLSTGGEGNAAPWRDSLTAISAALPYFERATGRIAEQTIELSGVLHPGYSPAAIQDWLASRTPDGWTPAVSADETPPSEGDQRRNLATGEAENYRQGYWLPDVSFPASQARCQSEIEAVLSRQKVQFVSNSARLDARALDVLNRLAAVAVRCVNSSTLTIQIAGHTDSIGSEAVNQRVSEDRAQVVLDELVKRGVRADAMTAIGFGETQPIATNNNADGRALNRRITFSWSEQDG